MLTTRSLNKQEMTEWLTEDMLGWPKITDNAGSIVYWKSPVNRDYFTLQHRIYFIYSPDGFFAVWDECLKGFESLEIEILNLTPEGKETWECRLGDHTAKGKDRYEAFYNAVYEAMNDSNA